jgi:hypothetical protein
MMVGGSIVRMAEKIPVRIRTHWDFLMESYVFIKCAVKIRSLGLGI